MNLLLKALQVVLAVAFVVLIYKVVPWLLGLLGITMPHDIWMVIMVIIGLIAIIGALRGDFGTWWKSA